MAKQCFRRAKNMKRFFNITILTSVLALCAAGTASANQLLVFVTPAQIQSLAGIQGGAFGTNCNTGLTNCGVFAVGFVGATTTGLTTNETISVSSGYAAISPDSVGTDKWVTTNILPSSGAGACNSAAGCSAFEVGGTGNGNAGEAFITGNQFTVGKSYNANIGDTTLTGVSPLNATTDTRGMGFLLTFANNIAAGTTVNVTFELLAAKLGTSSGTQGVKNLAGQATLSGLTLVATPEPASMSMLFGGLLAIGGAAWRRRKQK